MPSTSPPPRPLVYRPLASVADPALRPGTADSPDPRIVALDDGLSFATVAAGESGLTVTYWRADASAPTTRVALDGAIEAVASPSGRWVCATHRDEDVVQLTVTEVATGTTHVIEDHDGDDLLGLGAFVPGTDSVVFWRGTPDGGGLSTEAAVVALEAAFHDPPDEDDEDRPHARTIGGEGGGPLLLLPDATGERLFIAYDGEDLASFRLSSGLPTVLFRGALSPPYGGRAAREGWPALTPQVDGGGLTSSIEAMCLAAGGDRLLTAFLGGSRTVAQLWDASSGARLVRLQVPATFGSDARRLRLVSLHPGGRWLLVAAGSAAELIDLDALASRRGEAPVVDLAPADVARRFSCDGAVAWATFLPDGAHAVIVAGGSFAVYHVDHDTPVARWPVAGQVIAWALSAEGALACATGDGHLHLGRLEGYRAPTAAGSDGGWV